MKMKMFASQSMAINWFCSHRSISIDVVAVGGRFAVVLK